MCSHGAPAPQTATSQQLRLDLHLRIDGHHVLHWGHGGDTNLENLVLLCHRYHRSVHDGRRSWSSMMTGRSCDAGSHRYQSRTRADRAPR
jgi:hypothetical protein